MRSLLMFAAAAIAALTVSTVAWAGHGKIGLWDVSMTMKMSGMDTSRLSPRALAQLKAMGMLGDKGMTVNDQHCMTAAEVASDAFSPKNPKDHDCKLVNRKTNGRSVSGDLVCTGATNATGHMDFTFDSDLHYQGHMMMKGTHNGHPSNEDMTFEGHWVKADCGGVKS
jgi:hypothetical protein